MMLKVLRSAVVWNSDELPAITSEKCNIRLTTSSMPSSTVTSADFEASVVLRMESKQLTAV